MKPVWGITGTMGSGKTWLTQKLWKELLDRGLKAHTLLTDNLRYDALTKEWEPRHVRMRAALSWRFGVALDDEGGFDLAEIYKAALADRTTQADFSALLSPVLVQDAAEAIAATSGPVLLEWARLLEDGFAPLLNGPVILVSCSEAERERRFRGQDRFTAAELRARISLQPSEGENLTLGSQLGLEMIQVDTSEPGQARAMVTALADRLLAELAASPAPAL